MRTLWWQNITADLTQNRGHSIPITSRPLGEVPKCNDSNGKHSYVAVCTELLYNIPSTDRNSATQWKAPLDKIK